MHRAAVLLRKIIGAGEPTRQTARSHVLSIADASAVSSALKEDARDYYYYSGCASFASALVGINESLYTWATVELYYAVFYCLRARLALADIAIFHVNTSAFSVHAFAGSSATAIKENTHKAVLKTFERQFMSSRLLSQKIGIDEPLVWLTLKREEANYGTPRFLDPVSPAHFKVVDRYGLRRLISTYLADQTDTYTFDPDHAMIAYPLAVVREISGVIGGSSPLLSEVEGVHLRATCRDAAGPLSQFLSLLRI